MGHLLDPCDNSFHASVLKRYWTELIRHRKPDLETQIKIIHSAYFGEKESSIRTYFEKCGITGSTSPQHILQNLFYDGNNYDYHFSILVSFYSSTITYVFCRFIPNC